MTKALRAMPVVAAAVLAAACTVHQSDTPGLGGPSTLALSLRVTASPDSIPQDGASRSTIQVTAFGPSGQPLSGVAVRLDIRVGTTLLDYGTLGARTITTTSDGKASTTYTAPPAPDGSTFTPTCAPGIFSSSVPGLCVDIVATPISDNFQATANEYVTLRLVPEGVVLPPADTPKAAFVFSPTPVQAATPEIFDASTSCAGSDPCTDPSGITSFLWNFGDGTTASGQVVKHPFTSVATFTVSLTVTNDRGVSNSTSQPVAVTAPAGPTASFVFSPDAPAAGQAVQFNAETSTSTFGHSIVEYQLVLRRRKPGDRTRCQPHLRGARRL